MRLRKRKNATVLIRNGLILMQPPTHLELHEMRNLEIAEKDFLGVIGPNGFKGCCRPS